MSPLMNAIAHERLKEVRDRYAPGKPVEYGDIDKVATLIDDVVFLLAVLDSGEFQYWCTGCRFPFATVDSLLNHPACKFRMVVEAE